MLVLQALEGTALQFDGGHNQGANLLVREGITQLGRAVKASEGYRFPPGWVQVSSKHCKIIRDSSVADISVYVEDSSTNGTFINGDRLERGRRYEMRVGDILSLSVAESALRYRLEKLENEGKRPASPQELFSNGNKRQRVQEQLTMDDVHKLVETLQKEKEELRKNEAFLDERIRELEGVLKKVKDENEFLLLQVQQKEEAIQVSAQEAAEKQSAMKQQLKQTEQQMLDLEQQVQLLQRQNVNLQNEKESLLKQLEQQEVIHVVKHNEFKQRVSAYFTSVQEVQKKLGLDIDIADTQKEQMESSEVCSSGDNQHVDSVAATIPVNSDKRPQSQQAVPSKNEFVEVKRSLKINMRSSAPSVVRETMDQQQVQEKVVIDPTQAATVRQEGRSNDAGVTKGVHGTIVEDEGQEVPATGIGFFMGLTNNQTIAESEQQF
eukprot:TRINITY_DN16008_c0_g1_i1.p1 TRINITY_DN16008_c0_g1~~TRINITY_DN16008_c0_g1_i1.p1  ORF type:complete len:436 (-),score=86.23 TRINITY_DN16008_c0_g1_i1:270-1577(-)